MPFFRDQNLLFVHIPRNAGRSIEVALLGPTCSPDAAVTASEVNAVMTNEYAMSGLSRAYVR